MTTSHPAASVPFYCLGAAMHANAIDSEAVFRQRVEELGLKAAFDKFKEFGWASHGNFAFAMASGPGGVVEDERFVSAVIRPLFGLGPEAPPPELREIQCCFQVVFEVAVV